MISFGNGAVRLGDCVDQFPRIIDGEVAGHSPVSRRRADQPCRILSKVTSFSQKAEVDSGRSLGSVDSECGYGLAVTVGKEAREVVWCDDLRVNIPLEPSTELFQISQVGLPPALTPAIGPELCVEALDRYRELQGFISFLLILKL